MSDILIVDDELSMREMLEIFFEREGHKVTCASDGEAAISALNAREFDLVITDLRMPKQGGLRVLEESRRLWPTTPVIVMTAFASTETAISAMKLGACDYFTKPFKLASVRATIDDALERRQVVLESRRARAKLSALPTSESTLLGESPAMCALFDMIARVARTRANILILGESGTGKELAARALHAQSDRHDNPFIVVNCGAIPENLIESELFGHKRGSFTGAVSDHDGLFKAAQGGTLFLDEVGELPLQMQVKLLRALQERRIRPVGDSRELPIDVRVISATNRDLEAEVRAGRFREDLYYRLNVISLELPPLRERRQDIPLLALAFLKRFSSEFGKEITDFEPRAMQALTRYNFPGNIRELQNVVERACALEDGKSISLRSLPDAFQVPMTTAPLPQTDLLSPELEIGDTGISLEGVVDEVERRLISQALERTEGRKKAAARLLGITFRSLRYRLEKLDLKTEGDDAP